MAKDYLTLGTSPWGEECVQVTDKEPYIERMREECNRYIELIRKVHGDEPVGASLKVKTFHHDFGPYMEVVCWYDVDNEVSIWYAQKVEDDTPATWDDEASDELS